MYKHREKPGSKKWQKRLYEIIFESDTPAGKAFDVALLIAIILSIAVVMAESVEDLSNKYRPLLRAAEWFFTIIFTVEYFIRLAILKKPSHYMRSFFGIVDFLAIIPSYLSIIILNSQYFLVIRAVRLLRVFRIFKLGRYMSEGDVLLGALKAARHKITVFLGGVGTMVIIFGTMMYMIEGAQSGFTSIPRSIYWAIVTLTTVGYGDIAPQTFTGQTLASFIMILGYSIIAVPTGLVTAEISRIRNKPAQERSCPSCSAPGHDSDALFCKRCGFRL